MASPPKEPQPQRPDTRTLIRSPDRIHRWMAGTGEFNNQPISPSNNVPDSPPSGIQYALDDGVYLRSPSIGSVTGVPHDVLQEGAQPGAGFTGNNQQPNQENSNAMLGQLASYYNMLSQNRQRNEHLLHNIYELTPFPNSGDHARQGVHNGNHRVEDPSNSRDNAYQDIQNANHQQPNQENSIAPPNQMVASHHSFLAQRQNRELLLRNFRNIRDFSLFPNSGDNAHQGYGNNRLEYPSNFGNNAHQGYGNNRLEYPSNFGNNARQGYGNNLLEYPSDLGNNGHQGYGNNDVEHPSNLGDNADQGIHNGNNRVEHPSNSSAFQNCKMITSSPSSELSNDDATVNNYLVNTMLMNNFSSPANEAGVATSMMNRVNHYYSQQYHGGSQPQGQRVHQRGMTTGMMNPMNNYQGGIIGQASENTPVPTHHTNHGNNISWNIPQYQAVQRNDYMLYNNMASTQQAIQSSGSRMPTNLPYTNPINAILERDNSRPNAEYHEMYDDDDEDEDDGDGSFTTPSHPLTTPSEVAFNQYTDRVTQSPVPHTPSGYASDQRAPGPVGTGLGVPNVPGNMLPSQYTYSNEQGLGVPNVPGNMLPNQHAYSNEQGLGVPNVPGNMLPNQHTYSNDQGLDVPNVPEDIPSNQHIVHNEQGSNVPIVPGDMPPYEHIVHSEQDLHAANVLSNMPQNEHTVRNEQGDMPASDGDQMDTSEDRILSYAAQPFNAINSGPFSPQDTSSRQLLQFDSNPTATSNVEETGAALDSEEADTRSAMDFSPTIPGTLASNAHQLQMETPQASTPLKHPAMNQKSDTRKDSSQSANRVNKSIRRRKPAKTQKLLSAIANSASQLLEESASQDVEAQNDPKNSASQDVEAGDESDTSVESVD
ncbi:uncharacterized protein EAE98_006451 [Botrytis deweyae]|uniref:Uncharacterized protein n=1 Tax=Botrytis deweyae TaxID=2478750 RepID=A0ABQ7IJD3_9HELO|nr:uncharacterized protein EAE98_006451 [Botrytis deweyae]KAF7926156.1 hypothetical protein EAE98_006451 [Botrytis deweyae]